MAPAAPYLTKSKFLAGRHCHKRLWLSRHEPELATPPSASDLGIRAAGSEIGRLAHHLFPGGVLVEAAPGEHAAALQHTRALLADIRVPALFEAAFEFEGVRIRVDVLERLGAASFGLREVKAAARPKEPYFEDVALQRFVLAGCGIDITSVELIHVNTRFERGAGPVAWKDFFTRVDVADAVSERLGPLPPRVEELLAVVAGPNPTVEPGLHCRARRPCEFWEHCTRAKPDDWVLRLPRLTRKQAAAFAENGVERIGDIPAGRELTRPQQLARRLVREGGDFVHAELAYALVGSELPACYLDFETMAPAVPLYPGTHPFQGVPFQWSLHRLDAAGELTHREFLALGDADPRREFAESLLATLDGGSEPILVYSPFERRVLEILGSSFEDLRSALATLRDRLFDLLPVVRNHTYHADFGGSFSIKHVAPALAPGFGYAQLDGIAAGGAAAFAFEQIAAGTQPAEVALELREQLLAYCRHDTLALVHVHRALRERVAA